MLGVLGAIDPYTHKTEAEKRKLQKQDRTTETQEAIEVVDHVVYEATPDYFINVTSHALIKILRVPSLTTFYPMTSRALVEIVTHYFSDGQKEATAEQFLKRVMPHFLSAIRQIERPGQMLTHLAALVTVLQVCIW